MLPLSIAAGPRSDQQETPVSDDAILATIVGFVGVCVLAFFAVLFAPDSHNPFDTDPFDR